MKITSKPYLLLSSGKSAESREDVGVTKKLVEAGKIIGIDVLDHIVLGDGEYVSLKEKEYI
ncbi:JAB domain-containing protein [Oceanobacillus bengalensis]|uniref:DNA repair protein RadC n=1 Tax=Oceanobacillus bengalensis TaxID=1435466 RepID=A0A494YV98_9BACI|nr:JAB domain-containing protein [Oceanobacillus bengalensis]RKQ14119.1 DNA repair protein RadC [Oceanobacillus bengalensis]